MRSGPDSLRREITITLAVKLAAILLLWLLFFSPGQRPFVDASVVERDLLGASDGPRSAPAPRRAPRR